MFSCPTGPPLIYVLIACWTQVVFCFNSQANSNFLAFTGSYKSMGDWRPQNNWYKFMLYISLQSLYHVPIPLHRSYSFPRLKSNISINKQTSKLTILHSYFAIKMYWTQRRYMKKTKTSLRHEIWHVALLEEFWPTLTAWWNIPLVFAYMQK